MSTQPEPARRGTVGSLATLDRRTFIGVALGLVAASPRADVAALSLAAAPASAGSSARLGVSVGTPQRLTPGALLTALSDPNAAGWLGQRYLAEHPQEQDTNRLVDQLSAALNARQGQVPTDSLALRQALSALIEHEYVSAPLRSVDGWQLSPSEARLYALAALTATDGPLHQPTVLRAPQSVAGC